MNFKKEFAKYWMMALLVMVQLKTSAQNLPGREPVDYVNPNIGGIGHLLVATAPVVQLPHGMVELSSNTYPEIGDRYLADKISSFSIRALPRYETRIIPSWIMATTGEPDVRPEQIASAFDHDLETVTPYFSETVLEDYRIRVSNTVSQHSAYYRFSFPQSNQAHILLGSNVKIKISGNHAVEGEEFTNGVTAYFYAEFSKAFDKSGCWSGTTINGSLKEVSGNQVGAFISFQTGSGEQIDVKIGISHIDMQQARKNLEMEIPGWNFSITKKKARNTWNEALGKIQVEGGTPKERTIFYTALYRVLLGSQSVNLTEYGRYFSRLDSQVHLTKGYDYYRLGSNWGSHHSLFPLFLLLEPERQNDMLRSYVRMEQEGGWISNSGGRHNMIGHHEVATITDAYMKGFRDFDAEQAYEGMKRNAMEMTMLSRHNGNSSALTELDSIYLNKGFYPAISPGEKEWVPEVGFGRQSVSLTLENCYDDWCIAQMAKALGKTSDFEYFSARALNYRNVFDSATGFMRPKTADGKWIEPFDPIWSGGQGGRDYYTENNGWNYTWFVPHDVQGLIRLMEGRTKFIGKLNELFTTTVPLYRKFAFLKQFPDMTGWIGMYSHGNEITWHIPYLYNYAGAPWMTQRRVRQIMDIWYGDGPLGICGDEDYGEMSSWYVFSAMGFYPVSPGRTDYNIGSPLFSKITIKLAGGKSFIIEARDVSDRNKYIQSGGLNGKVHNRPWFDHSELVKGGRLILQMGAEPNKLWGSSPDSAPASMSR